MKGRAGRPAKERAKRIPSLEPVREAAPPALPGRAEDYLPPDLTEGARAKLDEVPCVSLDGERGLAWSLGPLPTADQVRAFMLDNDWLAPFGLAFTAPADLAIAEPWWKEVSPGLHAMPYPTWATRFETTRQRVLLDEACGLLRTQLIGQVVMAIKRADGYPSGWGWAPDKFRGTTERLFDRLRVNGIVKGDTYVRYGTWHDLAGEAHQPRETVFGLRGDLNAFYKLRKNLSAAGGSPLGIITGLGLPDSFALPLDWTLATTSGLSDALGPARLGTVQRAALEDLAGDVDELIDDLRGRAKKPLDFGLIGRIVELALPVLFGPVGVAGLVAVALLSKKELNTLADTLARLRDEIRRAAGEHETINEVGRILIGAVDAMDLRGLIGRAADAASADLDNLELLFGLNDLELTQLADALGGDDHHRGRQRRYVPTGFPAGQPVEMILLGTLFVDYAREFGEEGADQDSIDRYAAGAAGVEPIAGHRLPAEEWEAYRAWRTFWNLAKPSVDVAKVFDLAGLVLEKLLYLDDAYLALNDLVVAEGVVGDFVQRALAEQGLARIADALGGASPGAVCRYLFRQILTDYFIETMVERHGASRSCLHRIFCWMNSKAKREAIDAALGPVVDFAIGGSNIRLPLRAALVPPPPAPAVPSPSPRPSQPGGADPAGDAEAEIDRGALGSIWTTLADLGATADALDAIDSCNLAHLRDWLELTREDCLRCLEEALEPEWGRTDYEPPARPPDPGGIEPPGRISTPGR